jgi:hypothetical protein
VVAEAESGCCGDQRQVPRTSTRRGDQPTPERFGACSTSSPGHATHHEAAVDKLPALQAKGPEASDANEVGSNLAIGGGGGAKRFRRAVARRAANPENTTGLRRTNQSEGDGTRTRNHQIDSLVR